MSCEPGRHEWKIDDEHGSPGIGAKCLCGGTTFGDQQCECVNANHPFGRCINRARMHHFCGMCQSEGAKRMVPTDDERFEQWWNEDARRVDQNHLKLSARIGWNGALKQVSREREEARRREIEHEECVGDLEFAKENAELREKVEMWKSAEKRLSDAYLRLRNILNAWRTPTAATPEEVWDLTERCAQGVVNNLRYAEHTIESLRTNLASANADFANLHGMHVEALAEVEKLKRLLGGHTCYVNATIIPHTCKPPLGNPTREEAIQQRDATREALRRLMATGQSIIDVAKNGMRE